MNKTKNKCHLLRDLNQVSNSINIEFNTIRPISFFLDHLRTYILICIIFCINKKDIQNERSKEKTESKLITQYSQLQSAPTPPSLSKSTIDAYIITNSVMPP